MYVALWQVEGEELTRLLKFIYETMFLPAVEDQQAWEDLQDEMWRNGRGNLDIEAFPHAAPIPGPPLQVVINGVYVM